MAFGLRRFPSRRNGEGLYHRGPQGPHSAVKYRLRCKSNLEHLALTSGSRRNNDSDSLSLKHLCNASQSRGSKCRRTSKRSNSALLLETATLIKHGSEYYCSEAIPGSLVGEISARPTKPNLDLLLSPLALPLPSSSLEVRVEGS